MLRRKLSLTPMVIVQRVTPDFDTLATPGFDVTSISSIRRARMAVMAWLKGTQFSKAAKSQPDDGSGKDLPGYDDEIVPVARGLKIPYRHVNLCRKEGYQIERIV